MKKFAYIGSVFSFLYFVLFTSVVFGVDYEYYVYGGYDAAVNAWQKVSLIFRGNDYLGVLFLAAVVGALILFYAILVRAALGARVDPLRGFGVPFLGGLILGALFIIPKDALVIYDPVSARGPQVIDDIPRIVALSAYVSNKVERLMINIVDSVTISESGKYSRNAGGVSYSVLRELYTKTQLDDCSVTSLSNYMQDCVLSQINSLEQRGLIQKVKSGEIDFFTLLSNAAHPSLFVTVCNPTTKASEVKSCESAYNQNIVSIRDKYSTLLSPTGDFIRSACVQLGFSNTLNGLQQCHSLISSTFNSIAYSAGFGEQVGLESAKRQYDIAKIWRLVLLSNDPALATATIATSQTMSSFWGLGVHANSWLPVIKASVTSLAIALTPVVLILLVTPLAGRALSFVFGVFIWITCWTLVDALVLSLGSDLANYYASGLKSGTQTVGFGTTVSLVFPDFLEKVIATFGMLRWAGLGLATVLSTMLVRFGGTVMAMVASQITSAPMGAGASVGSQVAISPSSLLTGTVLPMETYGAVAVRAGGLGAIYNPLMKMETFGLSSKVYAGDHGISGDAYVAGRYAGSVQAVQLQSQTHTGTYTFGQERKLGEGLGRLGAMDTLSKGQAGLKFSREEVIINADFLASGKATDIQAQAIRGSFFKDREKDYGTALGVKKGGSELATAEAWGEYGKTYSDLIRRGVDPREAFRTVRDMGIPTDKMSTVFEEGQKEMQKAQSLGYSVADLKARISDVEFQQQLAGKGINVQALQDFLRLVDTLSRLGLSIDTSGLENLKNISRLANVLEGMRMHEGAKEFNYRATGEGWTGLSKVEGFKELEWHERHAVQALNKISSIHDMPVMNIRGVDFVYKPDLGWVPVGVSSFAFQEDNAKKKELSIEHRVQQAMSAKDEKSREEFYRVSYELSQAVKRFRSSKSEKDWLDLQVKIQEMVDILSKHGFSREQIFDFLLYKLGIGAGVGAGGRGGLGGGGAGFGLDAQGLSPSESMREREEARFEGSTKDRIEVGRFGYKSGKNFVEGLESAISGAFGRAYTFNDSIRKSLIESFERATVAREAESFSSQDSVKKGYSIPDPLIAKVFNASLAKHKNALLALKDVYLVLSNPQAAARLMEMNLLDPKEERQKFEEKIGSITSYVEGRISDIGEEVPNQSSMNENKKQVIGGYGNQRKQVEEGLRKREEESKKAEEKAKELEKEKGKREQKILENHYAVPGRRFEPDYMKEQLNRIDKNWHIREQYSSPESDPISPPEVNEEALKWWNRWLNK